MGYRIVYGPDMERAETKGKQNLRIRLMTAGFLLLGCILARLLWPEGAQALREVLLPGPAPIAEQAFAILADRIRGGEPVGEAVESFCRYVISHGTIH